MRKSSLIFGLVTFSLLFTGCKSQAGVYDSAPEISGSKGEKIKAPVFELIDLNGHKVSLKDLTGKVVFLDFWATWCAPCIIATPEIEKMAHDYKDRNVEILSISLDASESMVRRFVSQMNVTSRTFMVGNSQADLQYRVSALPTYFLIDQNGYVVSAWNGYHPSMVKLWRKAVDQLLES